MPIIHQNKMTVAAHRGDSYNYPENTMQAFAAALEAGAQMIETDVRLTRDLVAVLIHDSTVDRTTDGKGRVADMTYEELCALNAGTPKYPAKIPLFREFMAWVADKGVSVNIEIKEYSDKEGNLERCIQCIETVLAVVEEYGMADRILINSFDAFVLEYCYRKYGKKYMLHGFYPYSHLRNYDGSVNPDDYLYCACIFDTKNKSLYEDLIRKGIEPWVGASVTSRMMLQLALDNGARLVTTNDPAGIGEKISRLD